MVAKRIIPCLDIKGGRTVKGTKFLNLRDMGDPVELAQRYSDAGADELVFLDISATDEERSTTVDVVRRVAKALSIPFTVGGGVGEIDDVSRLLDSGADKISLNSAAVRAPELIEQIASRFGSQCVVVAIDTKCIEGSDEVFIQAGKKRTGRFTREWASEVVRRGAGEILLTSMDHDGVRAGFALELIQAVAESVTVPVIASGGAGSPADFLNVFIRGKADAALAAGIFHEGLVSVPAVKEYLAINGVEVRR
jgi:imidazole glycerol-phosphate synthase subunit HisF